MIKKHFLLIYLCLIIFICNGNFASAGDNDSLNVTAYAGGLCVVVTNASTNVEEITATLNGYLVRDAGGLCTCGFDYDVDSGVPYASGIWNIVGKNSGEEYSCNIIISEGTLYYFRAKGNNINGTTYGGELSFLTKPDGPTGFQAVRDGVVIQINLSWTKGTGADKTVIVKKVGSYPVNRADGTVIYNGTTTTYEDGAVVSGVHYFYRAWSYTAAGIYERYSDGYDEDSIIALAPATFDVRDITVIDNTVPTLGISVVVENRGGILADITVSWSLTRWDTGAVLDLGSDTFAVGPFSEYLYTVRPVTSYTGSVLIKFLGDGASATKLFTTQSAPTGAGYLPPFPPVPPVEVPEVLIIAPPIGLDILLLIAIPILIVLIFLILVLLWKGREAEEEKRKRRRRRRPSRIVHYFYH